MLLGSECLTAAGTTFVTGIRAALETRLAGLPVPVATRG
jgi:hypothetical protein